MLIKLILLFFDNCIKMIIVPGDELIYYPNLPILLPYQKRPQDHGICVKVDEYYIYMRFHTSDTIHKILPCAIKHHPLSPRVIRYNLRKVFPGLLAAVDARTAVQVFTSKTGQTGKKGYGAADVLRSFLAPL
jgi:hypothetical protein